MRLTRTQEARVENDHTNIVIPNDSSTIGCRNQTVHDKPFYLSVQKPAHALEVILAQMRSTPATLPDGIYKAVPLLYHVPQNP